MSEESKPIAPGGASPMKTCPFCQHMDHHYKHCQECGCYPYPDDLDEGAAESAEKELASLRARLSAAEKENTRQSKELDCGNLSCRKCAACTRILLDASRKGRDEALFQLQGLECVRLKDNEYLLKAVGALRLIAGCPCQVKDGGCGLCVTCIARAALSGSTITDAPTAPKASEIAADSSALEKALGALRRFGQHKGRCAAFPATSEEQIVRDCDCGLVTAISGGAHVDALKAQKEEVK